MASMDWCCCCFGLKRGTQMIGIIEIILGIVGVIVSSIAIGDPFNIYTPTTKKVTFYDFNFGEKYMTKPISENELVKYYIVTQLLAASLLALALVNIFASIVLILGVRMSKRLMLVPWLVQEGVVLFQIPGALIILLVGGIQDAKPLAFLISIVVYGVVGVYFFVCVFGLYRQYVIEELQNQPPILMQPLNRNYEEAEDKQNETTAV